MFLVYNRHIDRYRKYYTPLYDELVDICDTEDGVLESYAWHDCQEISQMDELIDDFDGVIRVMSNGGIALQIQLATTNEVLNGLIECGKYPDGTYIKFAGENIIHMFCGDDSVICVADDTKGVFCATIPDECEIEFLAIRRIEKLGKYYRILFLLSLQEKSTHDFADEMNIDLLFTPDGFYCIIDVSTTCGFVRSIYILDNFKVEDSLLSKLYLV